MPALCFPRLKVRSAMPQNSAANQSRSSVTQTYWGPRRAARFPSGLSAPLLKVAEHLAMFGGRLKANQIVLTGSPLPLYAARAGDHILVRCSRLAAVETTVRPVV
jgi:hypothetical protein